MRAARREDFGNFKADSGIGTGDKKAAAGLGRHIVGRKSPAHRLFPLFFGLQTSCICATGAKLVRWCGVGPYWRSAEMMRRAIAHIGLPAKTGIVARAADHETVAMLFREDARRRKTRMQRVAADDRGRGVAPFGKAIAIDEYLVRVEAQRLDRARHREEGRLQDIDTVDFFDARLTDAPAAARLDLDLQLAAALGGEFLAVVERSEEHTSELQSLMRISYAVFCLKKKKET